MAWLLVVFLVGVVVFLLIDLASVTAERDKALAACREKDAQIAELEAVKEVTKAMLLGTVRNLIAVHGREPSRN